MLISYDRVISISLTFVFLLFRDVFQMVQKAWIKAMSTRAAISPRTMYKRVSERSKKESSVSLALGSEELLSTREKKK